MKNIIKSPFKRIGVGASADTEYDDFWDTFLDADNVQVSTESGGTFSSGTGINWNSVFGDLLSTGTTVAKAFLYDGINYVYNPALKTYVPQQYANVSTLPTGTVTLNPPTDWNKYLPYIVIGGIAVVGIALLINRR